MLRKIKGFQDTKEATVVMAAIRHRSEGAALFSPRQAPASRFTPQALSR